MKKRTAETKTFRLIARVLLAFSSLNVFQLLRMSTPNLALGSLYQKPFNNSARVNRLDGLLTRVDIDILRICVRRACDDHRAWSR